MRRFKHLLRIPWPFWVTFFGLWFVYCGLVGLIISWGFWLPGLIGATLYTGVFYGTTWYCDRYLRKGKDDNDSHRGYR